MELFAALDILRGRKLSVVIAAIISALIGLAFAFHVSISPPGLKSRSGHAGAATARLIVNTPRSVVADLDPNGFGSLPTHAQLLGDVLASTVVRDDIAKRAGIPASSLAVLPPSVDGVIQTELETTVTPPVGAATLAVSTSSTLPVISIKVHAATPDLAASLADAAVASLESYVKSVGTAQAILPGHRPVITSLGVAQGSTTETGLPPVIGVIAAVVVFFVACYLIVLSAGYRRNALEARVAADTGGGGRRSIPPSPHGSGQARHPRFQLNSGHSTRTDDKPLRAVLTEPDPDLGENPEQRASR
jgi:hypothetical protein